MIIHVAYPSGERRELEEALLRHEWEQGNIPQSAMYWKEGMENWQPLASLLSPYAPPQVSPIPAAPQREGVYQYIHDPRKLTKVLVTFLWISFAIDLIMLGSNAMQFSLLTGGSYSVAEGEANDSRQAIVAGAYFICFLITGFTFLKWIRRGNINSAGFGAQGMEFSPGWSIGWYFIPIACIFKPYQSMREIWRVSHDPKNWQQVASGAVLKGWWTLWLLNSIASQASLRMSNRADDIDSLVASTVASVVEGVISMTLSIVAIRLVKRIAANQEELVGGEVL